MRERGRRLSTMEREKRTTEMSFKLGFKLSRFRLRHVAVSNQFLRALITYIVSVPF